MYVFFLYTCLYILKSRTFFQLKFENILSKNFIVTEYFSLIHFTKSYALRALYPQVIKTKRAYMNTEFSSKTLGYGISLPLLQKRITAE
jgi:hypothetical protein